MRRRPALAACVVTLGASVAAMLGVIAALARSDDAEPDRDDVRRIVEVRLANDVTDGEARAAIRAWLEGQPDLGPGGPLTVIDATPDIVTAPS